MQDYDRIRLLQKQIARLEDINTLLSVLLIILSMGVFIWGWGNA